MKNAPDLNMINEKISKIKHLLLALETEAEDFPALSRNSKRAIATIKMLELNISDLVLFDLADS